VGNYSVVLFFLVGLSIPYLGPINARSSPTIEGFVSYQRREINFEKAHTRFQRSANIGHNRPGLSSLPVFDSDRHIFPTKG
jgi:hypothetical protein